MSNPAAKWKPCGALGAWVALAALGALFVFVHDGWRLVEKTTAPGVNDFETFWQSARAAVSGGDVYALDGGGYTYLPPFYILIAPLGYLPLVAAAILWHSVKCVLVVWIFVALWRMLAPLSDACRGIVLAVTALGIGRALNSDLQLGQTNVLVLFFLVLAAKAMVRSRELTLGAAIAIATLVKITPAIFFIYLAWKRRYKALLAGVVALVICGVLAPALFFGPAAGARLYERFYDQMIVPTLTESAPRRSDGSLPGQSLLPVLFRYLTPMNATTSDREQDVRFRINVVTFDDGVVAKIVLGAQIALLAFMLACTRPRTGTGTIAGIVLLEFGLVAAVMLLAAPYARKAHFVAAALPFAGCAAAAPGARAPIAIAGVVFAAVVTGATAPDLLGKELAARAEACGPFTLSTLILLVCSAHYLRRTHRGAHVAPSKTQAQTPPS